jgi:sec-independent protein translocase protein TatC
MAIVPFQQKSMKPAPEPDWDDEDDSAEGGKMSFLEHLDELRKRLIWALGSLLFGALVAWFFLSTRTLGPLTIDGVQYGPWSFGLIDFIIKPISVMTGTELTAIDPTEIFNLYVKFVVLGGLIIASPLVMSQVWLFIAPGLYTHEKKLAVPFVLLTSVCLVAGAAFGHYVAFPKIWGFLAELGKGDFKFEPRIDTTFALYLRLILAFAVIFQMPTIVLLLSRLGIVTARFMLRHFKYAVLIIFILAAVITPDGNPINQVVMAGPMLGLYVFSILLAAIFGKKRRLPDEA